MRSGKERRGEGEGTEGPKEGMAKCEADLQLMTAYMCACLFTLARARSSSPICLHFVPYSVDRVM